jgi:membrane protein
LLSAPRRLIGAWLRQLVELQFVERSVAIGSYAFTALIPLLLVYGAIASKAGASGFADRLSRRFELKGSAAASVHQAFAPPGDVAQGITVLSVILVLFSALTLTRGLQRLYGTAYGLPSLGIRGTPWGLAWLALIPFFLEARHLIASISHNVLGTVLALALAAACWTVTPYVLLARRLPWTTLLPGGIVTALAMSALTVASIVYVPESVSTSAAHYGVIGVAFALLGWLVACGFVLVGSAAAGAVLVGRGAEGSAEDPGMA